MTDDAPEVDPDGRPRPQFGEYATPEEQRARIRQPETTAALSNGQAPDERTTPRGPAVGAAPSVRGRGRLVDRVVTGVLLGYGLFIVLTSIPTFIDYGGFASTFLSALGVSATLADPGAGRGWGLAASLVLGVGWLVAVLLSFANLRAGRITFWIPLVAGIVCNLVSSALVIIPLVSDHAVWSAIESTLMGSAGR
ncbi:DUF6264 family protein [Microbacterium sp. SORGH_AS_0888]|uniref:DUF6264 family protein n=1 Tax=Microbacterium sp. SORGH_AS_0888 TaxID=3041791 RepID=UPI002784C77D|nr:DUF6264 family protein [Microbacterium sp. SORGH_AS_0888]MDQ1128130.1 hypothetical protein [Microbacterium sp. SORGH_AS_0888]